MLNVLDVQEIEMESVSRVAELEADFQRRFNAPLVEAALVVAVLEDPAAAEQLKREDPEQFERVSRAIKRMQSIARGQGGE